MLMVIGMSSVLIFLTLLIVVVTVMTRLVRRFVPEVIPSNNAISDPNQDGRLVAVISAAIHRHRQHTQRKR